MVGPNDLESLCHEDPFGEASDFELWPPPDPDDYEFLTSTDLFV
jgi:hypothetical protein